ncbi:MAG: YlmC/YmxH family sporulation protein [Thermoanaerobacterales bacterium]|jgi:YlmC/YmxH family sporulation protein|nr:YlmC/YmxH family sporulation protein [Thermoanaerobacterales bacterium]
MIKTSDLRQKEVINVIDGKRLGFISDLDIDLEKGIVKALIIPGHNKLISLFTRAGEHVIPWEKVNKIGEDVILVDMSELTGAHK